MQRIIHVCPFMLVFVKCFEYSLSSLAIFVLDMGIAGVAWGLFCLVWLVLWILWSQLKLPFEKPTFGLDKELLTLALPAAGERLMMRAGDVVIIALVVSLDGGSCWECSRRSLDPV